MVSPPSTNNSGILPSYFIGIDAPVLSVTKHRGFVKSLEYFKKQVYSKDISKYKLVSKGNFAYATIHLDEGSIGLLKEFESGYISPMYTVFKINSSVDRDFLFYLLKTEKYLQKYSVLGEGTVNRRKAISFQDLSKLKIPLPEIEEQKKIASILSNVNNLMDSYEKAIETTKKFKKGLVHQLLTKGIRHKKFKKVKWLFGEEIEIPEEWEVVLLRNLCHKRKNTNIQSELYIGIENIESGTGFLTFRSNAQDFLIKKPFKKNDVMYSKLRPYLEKVWLADADGFCSSDIYALVPNEKITSKFLLISLLSKEFLKFANATTAGGNIPKTRWNDIKNYKLFLPHICEQQKITDIISNTDSKISDLESKKTSLQKLKKGLMQKLLTGQIRV